MIVEFALTVTLAMPDAGLSPVQIEFSEPVRQVVTYPPDAILNQLSGLPLPEGPSEAFRDDFMEGRPYFGAFAITKEFGYGYVTGANSIEAARDIAIEECLKHGPRCMLYAELMPMGYVDLEPGQVSLAPEAGTYYTNPEPDWGNFRAMAISEDGAYSVVWNYASPAEASAAALEDCAEYLIENLPELRPMPCMLVPFK